MALIKFGGGVVQMSGSIGGTTFSRNSSGNIARARTTPVNPQSARQEKIRAIMAYLSDRWLETVTALQRAAWGDYALAVAMKNRLGETTHNTGMNHYIRSNAPLLQIDESPVDDAPTILALPDQDPTVSFTASEATQNLSVIFDDTAAWDAEVGGFMHIRMSRPQNPTRNFFGGPYLYADSIVGAVVPETSPATIAAPTPIVEGHRLWIKYRIQRADARLSEAAQVGPTDVGA